MDSRRYFLQKFVLSAVALPFLPLAGWANSLKINAAERQTMIDACAKAKVKLLVGYRMHFEPIRWK